MDQKEIFLIIIGMMVVTYGPRALPVMLLSARRLPGPVSRWLELIPAAVLSALLLPGLLAPEGNLELSAGNYFLWAAPVTLFAAARFRSFVGAILAGMAVVAVLRWMF